MQHDPMLTQRVRNIYAAGFYPSRKEHLPTCGECGGRQRTSRRADGRGELESVSPFPRETLCERNPKRTSHPQSVPEGGGLRGWRRRESSRPALQTSGLWTASTFLHGARLPDVSGGSSPQAEGWGLVLHLKWLSLSLTPSDRVTFCQERSR